MALLRGIRKWNGLGSNRVAKGRRLRLHVDNGGVAFASAQDKRRPEKDWGLFPFALQVKV